MPISSFRLKGPLGRNYKTDFDDTLRTKEALRDLEYYDEPSYGMTGYPDEPLFTAIEEFQNDHGLQRDGVMKPGGETEGAIKAQLVSYNAQEKYVRERAKDRWHSGCGSWNCCRPRGEDSWAFAPHSTFRSEKRRTIRSLVRWRKRSRSRKRKPTHVDHQSSSADVATQ
jgi:hypothetical protein